MLKNRGEEASAKLTRSPSSSPLFISTTPYLNPSPTSPAPTIPSPDPCTFSSIVVCEMKLSMQSLARKLSPKRGKKEGGKRDISRSEAPSFASTASSSSASSSDEGGGGALARSAAALSPRSVLRPAEISRRELEAVLRRLGHGDLSAAELDAVAAIAAATEDAAGGDQDELMEAFRVFDADGDGRIDAEELRGVMEAILGAGADGCSLDDCRRMIGGVDADGDGFVGFQDFARMMMTTTTTATTAAGGGRFM